MEPTTDFWRKCSTCKKSISFRQKHYVCSVSTCNGLRTGYVFCSVHCWDVHVPGARHREASAVEKVAPEKGGNVRIVVHSPAPTPSKPSVSREILVVASKLKDYIRQKSEMNTSASVMEVLSDFLRIQCDMAIEKARQEGRKTVLDRDFQKEHRSF